MKYKVGDKARVRSDLEIDGEYDEVTFCEDMAKVKGNIVTIKRVNECNGIYEIEEADGYWWSDAMLEDIEEKEYIVYTYSSWNSMYSKEKMTKEEVLEYMENHELAKLDIFRIKDKVKINKIFELED